MAPPGAQRRAPRPCSGHGRILGRACAQRPARGPWAAHQAMAPGTASLLHIRSQRRARSPWAMHQGHGTGHRDPAQGMVPAPGMCPASSTWFLSCARESITGHRSLCHVCAVAPHTRAPALRPSSGHRGPWSVHQIPAPGAWTTHSVPAAQGGQGAASSRARVAPGAPLSQAPADVPPAPGDRWHQGRL